MKEKILFVDNDPDFLETRREFLEKEGYGVVTASSPSEAKKKLEQEMADLAVIDIRLLNDDDEKDNSGLELAKDVSHHLPIIILTGYPSTEYARKSLATQLDGTHIAFHFLIKAEGPTALLSAILRTLEVAKQQKTKDSISRANSISQRHQDGLNSYKTHPDAYSEWVQKSSRESKIVKLNVPEQMLKDYELARLHARQISWARLGLVIGGALIILFGVIMVILGYRDAGILGAISGAIAGTFGSLMNKLANDANRRWEQFHKELMLLYKEKTKRKKRDT